MYKKIISLVLVIIMFTGISINAFAIDSNQILTESKYSVDLDSIYDVVYSSEWSDMVRPDRIDACQIPNEILDKLSTTELIQAVLDFPFFIDIYAFDTISEGYSCVFSECKALQTLVRRNDKAETIIKYYSSMDVPKNIKNTSENKKFDDLWKMELLISQDDFCCEMSDEQKVEMLNIAESKLLAKSQNLEIYSGSNNAFFESASENSALSLYSVSSTVYTPKGSAVSVYKWTSNDSDFSSAEISSLNSQYAKAYPNATRLANPTKKYNCHSYAWYSQSTSNIYWMNNPSKYMTDGSYNKVTKMNTLVGDRMVYYTSTNGTNSGINHSAIIVSYVNYPKSRRTFVVKSKWGQLGLYQHSWDDGPYMYWNGSKSPSDLEYYHR